MNTTSHETRIAVVTGASRREGIGYEVARQLARKGMHVVLTARRSEDAKARAAELSAEGLPVTPATLDITDDASVRALADALAHEHGHVDVLVNNAAVDASYGEQPSTSDLDHARQSFEVNVIGPWRTTQALLPLLRKGASPRVVNVSSGGGSHSDPHFGLEANAPMGPAYGISKAALNALTSTFARELADTPILVNAVCPGFTATFPGGAEMGARPVAEGAASVVWAAELPDDGPRGGFFRDGATLGW